jgi:Tfp pilus assembly pilus retraction ATPase PilT
VALEAHPSSGSPDVILIDEIWDSESAWIALSASKTGHFQMVIAKASTTGCRPSIKPS